VLNAVRPVGGAHILICDFSGLGLSAAVAALPVAEMFYQMTSKGYALSDIVRDINSKLHFILPQGFFLFGLCHVINRRK
jgi:serine phosphatase RsbU (regulator of sigma subunit)